MRQVTVKELTEGLERYAEDAEVLVSDIQGKRCAVRSLFMSYQDVIIVAEREDDDDNQP